MSQVLAITGRVLPVTNENVQLEATFENGTSVVGESKISAFKKAQDCRITQVRLLPERPPALPETLRAIRDILEDDTLEDPECVQRIDAILSAFYLKLGAEVHRRGI